VVSSCDLLCVFVAAEELDEERRNGEGEEKW